MHILISANIDMASPVIRVLNPSATPDRQQAVIMATKEARAQLLDESTALAQAKRLLRAGGIPAAPSRQQCLGKLVVPFGQYLNALFHWLVANYVGYMK